MVVLEDSATILQSLNDNTYSKTLPYSNKKRRVGQSHKNPFEVVVGTPKHKSIHASASCTASPLIQQNSLRQKSISLQNVYQPKEEKSKTEGIDILDPITKSSPKREESDNQVKKVQSPKVAKEHYTGRTNEGARYSKRLETTVTIKRRSKSLKEEEREAPDFHEVDFTKAATKCQRTKSDSSSEILHPWKSRTDTLSSSSTKMYDSEGSGQSYISFTANRYSTLERGSISSRRGSSKSACPQNFIPGENKGRKVIPALVLHRKSSVCFHGISVNINKDAPRTFRALAHAGILGLVIPSPSKHGCKS